jgi:hypothetical protein
MECFRIDESGYTGFDLLNEDQRFQGASAISISDEDAKQLIDQHFPNLQAPELKYRTLSRRRSNHPGLLALMQDLLSNFKCVTYVCDKRFMLTLMFVDYAVEPFYNERGHDFYADGQNYAMASMLHMAGPALLGTPQFGRLMACFQRAMKEKTGEALNDLVVAAKATNWRQIPEAIEPLANFAASECLKAIATPGVSTDVAFIVLQSMITRMELMAKSSYRVEHDQSKNLVTYHELLQRFIDHQELVQFRMTEITTLSFPLKLTEVKQVDSKDSPAVQLADVMIGAAIEASNNLTGLRNGGLDPKNLLSLYADEQLIHMLPSTDFDEQRRFRQGNQGSELINYLAVNLFRPKR